MQYSVRNENQQMGCCHCLHSWCPVKITGLLDYHITKKPSILRKQIHFFVLKEDQLYLSASLLFGDIHPYQLTSSVLTAEQTAAHHSLHKKSHKKSIRLEKTTKKKSFINNEVFISCVELQKYFLENNWQKVSAALWATVDIVDKLTTIFVVSATRIRKHTLCQKLQNRAIYLLYILSHAICTPSSKIPESGLKNSQEIRGQL